MYVVHCCFRDGLARLRFQREEQNERTKKNSIDIYIYLRRATFSRVLTLSEFVANDSLWQMLFFLRPAYALVQ